MQNLHVRVGRIYRYLKVNPTSLFVYVCFAIFSAAWLGGFLGSYGAAIGAVLGSVAIAVSSLGSGHLVDKWIVAGLGTALVGICAVVDTTQQLQTEHLKNALEMDVQAYAQNREARRDFATFLDHRLHDCLARAPVDLNHCIDLESMLEHVAETNGSVPAYRAAILRYYGRISDSDDQMYNYLEAVEHVAVSKDKALSACDANGYCRQRTGWICQSLANDYFRQACDALGVARRRRLFEQAEGAVKCVEREYGHFDQHLGTMPLNTDDLRQGLKAQLANPERNCPGRPLG